MPPRLRESPSLVVLWVVGLLIVAAACLAVGLVLQWTSGETATLVVGAVAAGIAVPPTIEVLNKAKGRRNDARIRHTIDADPNKVGMTAPVLLQALNDHAHVAEVLAVLGQSDQLDAITPETREQLRDAVTSLLQSRHQDAALGVLRRLDAEDRHVDDIAQALPNPRALDLLSRIPTQHAADTLASKLTNRSDEEVLQAVVAHAASAD